MSNRKYFGTDGIRGKVGEMPITPDFVLKLGWAAGKVLARHGSKKIIIGKDTRISGYMLESALEAGLAAAGLSAAFTGPMPTPAIAYLTRTFRAEAGIVISASHNPFDDNGIKFFSAEGTKLPDDVEEAIELEMEKPLTCVESAELGRASRIVDAAGRYIEFCKGTFPSELNLNGLKIVVDCANGATYHIAPNVLRELGATGISIATQPDGMNINKECGATDLRMLQERVVAEKADLGLAYDGDGDRIAGADHRRLQRHQAGHPARLPAAHPDPAHQRARHRADLHPLCELEPVPDHCAGGDSVQVQQQYGGGLRDCGDPGHDHHHGAHLLCIALWLEICAVFNCRCHY